MPNIGMFCKYSGYPKKTAVITGNYFESHVDILRIILIATYRMVLHQVTIDIKEGICRVSRI